jgi:hypothetical protein
LTVSTNRTTKPEPDRLAAPGSEACGSPRFSRMTVDQYRKALAMVGLTQQGAAAFFCVDERMSRDWAAGRKAIPLAVAYVLKLMIFYRLSAADIMVLLSGRMKPRAAARGP